MMCYKLAPPPRIAGACNEKLIRCACVQAHACCMHVDHTNSQNNLHAAASLQFITCSAAGPERVDYTSKILETVCSAVSVFAMGYDPSLLLTWLAMITASLVRQLENVRTH